ncbi:MAG: hypothetical protein ACLR2E_22940 [Lachnospiraceae bacterium]
MKKNSIRITNYVLYDSSLNEEDLIRKSQAFSIEGALVLGESPKTCEYLAKCMPKPVVFIDSEEGPYDNVSGQSVDGARSMAEYLLSQGHGKIAFSAMNGWSMGARRKNCRASGRFWSVPGKGWRRRTFLCCPRSGFCARNFPEFCSEGKKQEYTAAFSVQIIMPARPWMYFRFRD